MTQTNTAIQENESQYITLDEYVYRLGKLKENALITASWNDIASILNKEYFDEDDYRTESFFRKRYHKLLESNYNNGELLDKDDPLISFFSGIEQKRLQLHDERILKNKQRRDESRTNRLLDIFRDEIKRFDEIEKPRMLIEPPGLTTICALLSDIHFGISYSNKIGEYNPDIAEKRMLRYADEICYIGLRENCHKCVLVMMGDLISGSIHKTISLQNSENVIQQTIKMSELTSKFIQILASHFENVEVHSVGGNHSRIEKNADDAMLDERLDLIIPWYCKTKCENILNVKFMNDQSYAIIEDRGNKYAAVHGDIDKDPSSTLSFIENAEKIKLNGIFSGHLHNISAKIGSIDLVQNGCLCGSGDEYCIKNRLHGVPSQVAVVLGHSGIKSIHPIRFGE